MSRFARVFDQVAQLDKDVHMELAEFLETDIRKESQWCHGRSLEIIPEENRQQQLSTRFRTSAQQQWNFHPSPESLRIFEEIKAAKDAGTSGDFVRCSAYVSGSNSFEKELWQYFRSGKETHCAFFGYDLLRNAVDEHHGTLETTELNRLSRSELAAGKEQLEKGFRCVLPTDIQRLQLAPHCNKREDHKLKRRCIRTRFEEVRRKLQSFCCSFWNQTEHCARHIGKLIRRGWKALQVWLRWRIEELP